jgi:hypothetical protein
MRRKMNEMREETGFKEVGPARTEGLARARTLVPKEVK